MPKSYAEKISYFDQIIAFCEREVISERKYNRGEGTRIEDLEGEIASLTSLIEQTDKEEIAQAVEGERKSYTKGSSGVSVATNLPDGSKDDKRAYTTEEMYHIMYSETRGKEDVKFSNMIWANDPKGIAYDPKAVFESQIEEAEELKEGQALIVPILANKHWTAGMFRKKDGRLQFLHNDPEGNEIKPESLLGQWLAEYQKEGVLEVFDLHVQQQHDGYNCGPYTISSLLTMAENRELDAEEIKKALAQKIEPEKLRAKHAEIIEEDSLDREGVVAMIDALKERAICSKMKNMYDQFAEEGRIEDGGRINCHNADEARALAEQIKKSYEDIGVKPCGLEQNGDSWVVRLPEKCQGKDPFKMNHEELKDLKKELSDYPPKKTAPKGEECGKVQAESSKTGSVFNFV